MLQFYSKLLVNANRSKSSYQDNPNCNIGNLTKSIKSLGKEVWSQEWLLFQYSDIILRKAFDAISKNKRDNAKGFLVRLQSAIDALGSEQCQGLLSICVGRILAVINLQSNRERDCVALLNTAIYKCPLANCKSMNGLAESLMLLSQGYISLGHLEDALHSICLAVDFASERYEDVSKSERAEDDQILSTEQLLHLQFVAGRLIPGPCLDAQHALLVTFYALACQLYALGLKQYSADWFGKCYAISSHLRLDATIVKGLKSTYTAAKRSAYPMDASVEATLGSGREPFDRQTYNERVNKLEQRYLKWKAIFTEHHETLFAFREPTEEPDSVNEINIDRCASPQQHIQDSRPVLLTVSTQNVESLPPSIEFREDLFKFPDISNTFKDAEDSAGLSYKLRICLEFAQSKLKTENESIQIELGNNNFEINRLRVEIKNIKRRFISIQENSCSSYKLAHMSKIRLDKEFLELARGYVELDFSRRSQVLSNELLRYKLLQSCTLFDSSTGEITELCSEYSEGSLVFLDSALICSDGRERSVWISSSDNVAVRFSLLEWEGLSSFRSKGLVEGCIVRCRTDCLCDVEFKWIAGDGSEQVALLKFVDLSAIKQKNLFREDRLNIRLKPVDIAHVKMGMEILVVVPPSGGLTSKQIGVGYIRELFITEDVCTAAHISFQDGYSEYNVPVSRLMYPIVPHIMHYHDDQSRQNNVFDPLHTKFCVGEPVAMRYLHSTVWMSGYIIRRRYLSEMCLYDVQLDGPDAATERGVTYARLRRRDSTVKLVGFDGRYISKVDSSAAALSAKRRTRMELIKSTELPKHKTYHPDIAKSPLRDWPEMRKIRSFKKHKEASSIPLPVNNLMTDAMNKIPELLSAEEQRALAEMDMNNTSAIFKSSELGRQLLLRNSEKMTHYLINSTGGHANAIRDINALWHSVGSNQDSVVNSYVHESRQYCAASIVQKYVRRYITQKFFLRLSEVQKDHSVLETKNSHLAYAEGQILRKLSVHMLLSTQAISYLMTQAEIVTDSLRETRLENNSSDINIYYLFRQFCFALISSDPCALELTDISFLLQIILNQSDFSFSNVHTEQDKVAFLAACNNLLSSEESQDNLINHKGILKKIKLLREAVNTSEIIKLQSLFRGKLARNKHLQGKSIKYKIENREALKIQRVLRGKIARKKMRQGSSATASAEDKSDNTSRAVDSADVENREALKIQRVLRGKIARKKMRQGSSATASAEDKSDNTSRAVDSADVENREALKIQRVLRGKIARKKMRQGSSATASAEDKSDNTSRAVDSADVENREALKIQRVLRGKIARKKMRQGSSATASAEDKSDNTSRAVDSADVENREALKIQRVLRGKIARKKMRQGSSATASAEDKSDNTSRAVDSADVENREALKIQRVLRGKIARKKMRQGSSATASAEDKSDNTSRAVDSADVENREALKIQRVLRGKIARKKMRQGSSATASAEDKSDNTSRAVDSADVENREALKIQRVLRGKIARKKMRQGSSATASAEDKSDNTSRAVDSADVENREALKIQRVLRGKIARKKMRLGIDEEKNGSFYVHNEDGNDFDSADTSYIIRLRDSVICSLTKLIVSGVTYTDADSVFMFFQEGWDSQIVTSLFSFTLQDDIEDLVIDAVSNIVALIHDGETTPETQQYSDDEYYEYMTNMLPYSASELQGAENIFAKCFETFSKSALNEQNIINGLIASLRAALQQLLTDNSIYSAELLVSYLADDIMRQLGEVSLKFIQSNGIDSDDKDCLQILQLCLDSLNKFIENHLMIDSSAALRTENISGDIVSNFINKIKEKNQRFKIHLDSKKQESRQVQINSWSKQMSILLGLKGESCIKIQHELKLMVECIKQELYHEIRFIERILKAQEYTVSCDKMVKTVALKLQNLVSKRFGLLLLQFMPCKEHAVITIIDFLFMTRF